MADNVPYVDAVPRPALESLIRSAFQGTPLDARGNGGFHGTALLLTGFLFP